MTKQPITMTMTIFKRLFDTIFPRQCAMCEHRLTPTEAYVCTMCKSQLVPTGDHLSPLDNPTARLYWGQVDVERVVAIYKYSPSTPLAIAIHKLKYMNRPEIGEMLGAFVARKLATHGFFDDIDLIIPLPLHKRREHERGYNQSYHIAHGIKTICHLPLRSDIVVRTRYTQSQTTLSHGQRIHNVDGAFLLHKPDAIKGRHILLVDDIITTGASTISCIRAICQQSDVKVSIVSLGHTCD